MAAGVPQLLFVLHAEPGAVLSAVLLAELVAPGLAPPLGLLLASSPVLMSTHLGVAGIAPL